MTSEYERGFNWAAGELLRQEQTPEELRGMAQTMLRIQPSDFDKGAIAAVDRFEELTKS